jgi:glucosamine--fructose-6-phosphate aminotransferase (isomerizing)
MTSQMRTEIEEIPAAAARLLAADWPQVPPPKRLVSIAARGSSGHMGVYLRYLIETWLGLPVSAVAMSVASVYGRNVDLSDTSLIAISQSGKSPDLLAAVKAAKDAGAQTCALVNDTSAPLADAVHAVLPLSAGPEKAVAATKSVVNSGLGAYRLVANWAGKPDNSAAMPDLLKQALTCDWADWGHALQNASAAYVIGRGPGYGVAREIALKITETLAIPALAFSAAEFRHGPRAGINPATPILVLGQADETLADITSLADDLLKTGVPLFSTVGAKALEAQGHDDAALTPLLWLPPAYRVLEKTALAKGLDPDAPPGLQKVTKTV